MTDKQTVLEAVRGVPDNMSLQEILTTLQLLLADKHSAVKGQPEPQSPTRLLRGFGSCAGQFTVPDDFDDPLPADIQAAFEGR